MIAFIDEHRDQFGVEAICHTLGAIERGFITSRAGWEIRRDHIARLTKLAGAEGLRHGRKPITTRSASGPDARPDVVERHLTAERPHHLWAADIT